MKINITFLITNILMLNALQNFIIPKVYIIQKSIRKKLLFYLNLPIFYKNNIF